MSHHRTLRDATEILPTGLASGVWRFWSTVLPSTGQNRQAVYRLPTGGLDAPSTFRCRPLPARDAPMHGNPQLTGPTGTELSTPRDEPSVYAAAARPRVGVTPHSDVASRWMRYGVPVIRCSRAKRALEDGWGASVPDSEILDRFGRPEQAPARWSGQHSRDLVGLLTGRSTRPGQRGLLVVDLDMPHPDAAPLAGRWADCASGVDVLEMHARAAGEPYPETYTVMTPSIGKVARGHQLYFLQPEHGDLIGCATGAGAAARPPYLLRAPALGPMVDVRGAGGYVIAVGCHVGDRMYERVSPQGLGPQPLPGWLLQLLRVGEVVQAAPAARPVVRQLPTGDRAERYAAAALTGELEGVTTAPQGERNRRLYAAARRLAELSPTAPRVLSESTAQDELLAAARAAGLGEQEGLHTIRSGWNTGSRDTMGGAA